MREARESLLHAPVRASDARLGAGPGLVAAALGIDRGCTGLDLCDPASPLHLEARPAEEPAPEIEATPRIGIAYAGEPWVSVPWRFVAAGSPSLSRRSTGPRTACPPARPDRRPWTPARSPSSSSRPSGHGWRRRPRSTRRAASPKPWCHPTTRCSSRARWTRPTRPAPCSRTDPGSGSGRRTTSSRGSAARAGAAVSTPRSSSRSPRRSTRRRASPRPSPTSGAPCCATSAGGSTRCRRCAGRSPAASTRRASCSTRPRPASVRSGPASASPTTGCGAAWTRWSARSSAGRSRSPS